MQCTSGSHYFSILIFFFNLLMKIIYPVNFWICQYFFVEKNMSLFLPQWWQICVTCFLCLLVINICPVFLCINEKYLWVSDRRWLSAAATALSEFWCVLILLCLLVSFNVVVVFLESSERRHYGLELWCWRSYELVSIWFFLCFFFFIFVYWWIFRFVLWNWRWVMTLFRLCDFVWKSWIWFSELNKWIL